MSQNPQSSPQDNSHIIPTTVLRAWVKKHSRKPIVRVSRRNLSKGFYVQPIILVGLLITLLLILARTFVQKYKGRRRAARPSESCSFRSSISNILQQQDSNQGMQTYASLLEN